MNDDKQMEFFYEVFDASLPRLGPGDSQSTKKALDMLISTRSKRVNQPGSGKLRILDIGCGNGAQTIQLAKHVDGTILAVDNHQPFLQELQRRAEAEGVLDKIQTCLKDMRDLRPDGGLFDLIWSESALNLMGFCEALTLCHSILVPGGLLAASELCWLRPDPPAECRQFFANVYPAIMDIETNLATIKSAGYRAVGHFILPESAWWESYYHPLEDRLRLLREKNTADPQRLAIIDSIYTEIDIYRKYSRYYGMVFFMMQYR